MNDMRRTLLQYLGAVAVALAVLGGVSLAYHAHATAPKPVSAPAPAADTLVVNTTDMARDVIGFNDRTPLEIKLVDGVIVGIKALPNKESPGYFRRVISSPIFTSPIGKKPAEVLDMQLDAVSGATYSSEAVIENLRRGLRSVSQ